MMQERYERFLHREFGLVNCSKLLPFDLNNLDGKPIHLVKNAYRNAGFSNADPITTYHKLRSNVLRIALMEHFRYNVEFYRLQNL
jgi:hypothetical protein